MARVVANGILAVSALAGAALILLFVWGAGGVAGVVGMVWILAIVWAVFVLDRTEGSWEP